MNNEMLENQEVILEESPDLDNSDQIIWDEMSELAKKYYEKHHHLNMPINFTTKNGVDYDKDGKKLGFWIFYNQKNYNLLSLYKILFLQDMGLFKNIRKDSEIKEEFCLELGIDLDTNRQIIERLPMDELIAKINYLIENEMAISISGNLNEIFTISGADLEKVYGFTLEELVNKYYHQAFKLTRTEE